MNIPYRRLAIGLAGLGLTVACVGLATGPVQQWRLEHQLANFARRAALNWSDAGESCAPTEVPENADGRCQVRRLGPFSMLTTASVYDPDSVGIFVRIDGTPDGDLYRIDGRFYHSDSAPWRPADVSLGDGTWIVAHPRNTTWFADLRERVGALIDQEDEREAAEHEGEQRATATAVQAKDNAKVAKLERIYASEIAKQK